MNTNVKNPAGERILVGIDFTEASTHALDRALVLADAQPGSELHVLAVVESAVGGALPAQPGTCYQALEALVSQRACQPGRGERTTPRIVIHVRLGEAPEQLVILAAQVDATMIVVGTHGRRGLARLIIGSVAERVVREAACPVLVVRPIAHDESVLVPTLEPACPRCEAVRGETKGKAWWCESHAGPGLETHSYAYSSLFENPDRPGKLL